MLRNSGSGGWWPKLTCPTINTRLRRTCDTTQTYQPFFICLIDCCFNCMYGVFSKGTI